VINYSCIIISNKSPRRWPVYWPKRVGDDITVELHLSGLTRTANHLDNWIFLWKKATLAV